MQKRVVALFGAVLFAMSGVMARLYRLSDSDLKEAANEQSGLTVTVARVRGTLYDRNGAKLVNDAVRYASAVVPTPQALATLSDTLSAEEFEALHDRLQDGRPTVTLTDTPFAPTDGITVFTVPKRYGTDTVAAHLIGYLGDDGIHGASGMEKALDAQLHEASGEVKITYRTDGQGRVMLGEGVTVENTLQNAVAGVALTIDRDIQKVVETRATPLLDRGAAVVLDPYSGDVLALASFPDFEPSALADYLDDEDGPLYNRAIAAYNCGSVFKIVSAVTALENGVALTQTYRCDGRIRVGANVIKCHHVLGHGTLDLTGGFVQSCNPYFIQLIKQAGGAALYRMATAFGFNTALTLAPDYQTAAAVFPEPAELLQPTALANVSFGQGKLTATPVHIAQMTAAVVNGGVVRPARITYGAVTVNGEVIPSSENPPMTLFSPTVAAQVRGMMTAMIEDKVGEAARPQTGGAGGKSGTAETGWKTQSGDTMVQSWFTGFYPAEDPKYIVTVVSEDAETSKKTAAPVFKVICDALARLS